VLVIGVVVATVAALIISAVFYGVVPAPASPAAPVRPPRAIVVVELVRNVAVAGLVAGLLRAADWSGAATGLLLGLALCVLPVVLLAGAVFHEGMPAGLACRHAVDGCLKLATIGVIVGLLN
jgi:hypothetical protein